MTAVPHEEQYPPERRREALRKMLEQVEDPRNHYASFDLTYAACTEARVLASELFWCGHIDDDERDEAYGRIQGARVAMVGAKMAHVADRIREKPGFLGMDPVKVVSSIFYEVFPDDVMRSVWAERKEAR